MLRSILQFAAVALLCISVGLFALHGTAQVPGLSTNNSPNGAASGGAPAPGAPPAAGPTEELVARDSPRASMADFFALCRANQFQHAASYLELPRDQEPRGKVLAARLKAVLDREAWVDIEKLSPLATGDLDDELPRANDDIGRIEAKDGTLEPVRLVKRSRDGGRWLFNSATVQRIDGWYEQLADRWLIENLPAWLLRSGPKELLWWQWLALPLLILAAWAVGYLCSRIASGILARIAARTPPKWDDELVQHMGRPLTLWWTLGIIYLSLPYLRLYGPAEEYVHSLLRGAFLVGFFWVLSRAIGIGGELLTRSPWAVRNKASRSLIPLVTRVGHIALIAVAVVALLSQLGYPVASLLAGLGVGGLAVALAAQKTLENLFGAFSIGADQPFREGDFVRIDDFVATVEYIGLRSTKFRTLDRTLITIPNGKLADMRLESFAARDRLRFSTFVNLAYGTRPEQVHAVIAGLDRTLRAQPKLWPDGVTTRLMQITTNSIDIEVMAWFNTTDWSEFQRIREEVLLQFIKVVEECDAGLALPTHNVRLVPSPPAPEPSAGTS